MTLFTYVSKYAFVNISMRIKQLTKQYNNETYVYLSILIFYWWCITII